MTLNEALESVLALQKHWTATKSPDMDSRGEFIKDTIPALLKDSAEKYGFQVQGGAGSGSNNRVPWVRVFHPILSPKPTDGWYAVFLFAADGSAVFLSLNQGTTDRSQGRGTRKDPVDIQNRRDHVRSLLLGRGHRLENFLPNITLADPGGLGEGYEIGNVYALRYDAGAIPPDKQIHVDMSSILDLLKDVYSADEGEEVQGERSKGHVIIQGSASKRTKVKSAEDVRSDVQKVMAEILEEQGLEMARGGTGTAAKRLEERLNKTTGFWLDSGENQKPVRWLFHVVPSTHGPKAVWPSQPTNRYMGIVGASNRKAVLTYRLVPLFKVDEGKYEVNLGWEWLIWIALKHPLRSSLGNSAPVKNLSFQAEEVYIAGQRFPVLSGGIVGLCKLEDQITLEGFKEPIKYGDITKELVALISKLGTTEQQEAKFITAATAPVEGQKA